MLTIQKRCDSPQRDRDEHVCLVVVLCCWWHWLLHRSLVSAQSSDFSVERIQQHCCGSLTVKQYSTTNCWSYRKFPHLYPILKLLGAQ